MGRQGILHTTSEWYLIASHGAMMVRVRPGMPLGETPAGELSFDPSCAHLEIDIADDGSLVLSAVGGHELESAVGTRCRRERVTRHRRAEIHLPHNVLRLDTDFAKAAQAADMVAIRAVPPTEAEAPSPTEAPAESRERGEVPEPAEAPSPAEPPEDIEATLPAEPPEDTEAAPPAEPSEDIEASLADDSAADQAPVAADEPPAADSSSTTDTDQPNALHPWFESEPAADSNAQSEWSREATLARFQVEPSEPATQPPPESDAPVDEPAEPNLRWIFADRDTADRDTADRDTADRAISDVDSGEDDRADSLTAEQLPTPGASRLMLPDRPLTAEARPRRGTPPSRAHRPPQRKPEPDPETASGESRKDWPREPAGEREPPRLRPLLAAAVVLAALAVAVLYPMLREDGAPEPVTPADAGRPTQPDQGSTVTDTEASNSETFPTAPPLPDRPRVFPNASEPADVVSDGAEVAAGPLAPRSQPEGAPIQQPGAPAQRQPESGLALPADGTASPDGRSADRPPPDPALVAQLETVGVSARALATRMTRHRDLLAANLALTQGRLTTPPESSAYTLYSRVLSADPSSEAARSGLQSVRQELINRALAQLAGSELTEARQTLKAAADAGANPQLVADLRGEVDYRQRLVYARAGRFDSLYPADQLVPISQEPPRVPRSYSGSVEVQFTVTMEGEVSNVAVLDAAQDNVERAVRRAVSEWRFEPVLYNGRPLPVRTSVRFDFPN